MFWRSLCYLKHSCQHVELLLSTCKCGRPPQRCGKRVKTLFVTMVFGTFQVIETWNQTVCNPTSKSHHVWPYCSDSNVRYPSNIPLLVEIYVDQTQWTCDPPEWQVELGEAKRSAEQIISTNTGVKMARKKSGSGWKVSPDITVDSDFWEVIDLEVWEFCCTYKPRHDRKGGIIPWGSTWSLVIHDGCKVAKVDVQSDLILLQRIQHHLEP